MPAQVVSFLRRARPLSRDWSQDELAEFYRVESALLQAGMRIETERGVTDEGDPWFAFCRADDGETFIHFARIDGRYIIAGPAYEGVAQGYDFPELVRDLISRHPLVQPQLQRRNNTNIFMHPAALLIAVVGTAFFKTADAKAAETSQDDHKERRHGGASPATVPAPSLSSPTPAGAAASVQVSLDAAQTLTLVASAMAAMTPTTTLGKTGGAFAPLLAPLPESATHQISTDSHQALMPGHAAFQPAPVSAPVTVGELTFTPASTPTTAAVGAWLSLAAVLQDLPKPAGFTGGDALSSVLALLPSDIARHGAQAVELAKPPTSAAQADAKTAPAPAAPATLVIELSSAALPDVAAVRLVRDLQSGVNHDSVLKLEQLPDLLAQLIARGAHLETDFFNPAPPSVEIPHDQPATALPAAPTPVETVPTSGLQPNPVIDNVIAYFVSHAGQTEVVLNGHDIVIYDIRIMTDPDVLTRAESVTYTFDDGSSVSLVGTSALLHEAGALH